MDAARPSPSESLVLSVWASAASQCVHGDSSVAVTVALIEAEAPAMFREMGRLSDRPLGVLNELWHILTFEQMLEIVPIDSDVLSRLGRRIHWAMQAVADGRFEATSPPPYDPVSTTPTPTQVRQIWADAARKYLRGDIDLLGAYWLILCLDRDYYNDLADDPQHPLHTLRAFFSQLSSKELHDQEPIEPAFLAAYRASLNRAFSQLAESGDIAIDRPGSLNDPPCSGFHNTG